MSLTISKADPSAFCAIQDLRVVGRVREFQCARRDKIVGYNIEELGTRFHNQQGLSTNYHVVIQIVHIARTRCYPAWNPIDRLTVKRFRGYTVIFSDSAATSRATWVRIFVMWIKV